MLATYTTAHAADYPTVDVGIAAASADCAARFDVHTVECATAVIATASGFRMTEPVRGERESFRLSVKLAKGERLAALFHTHPGSDSLAEKFSGQDVSTADALNVPSYILIVESHHVRVYEPKRTPTYHMGYAVISDGRLVSLDTTASS